MKRDALTGTNSNHLVLIEQNIDKKQCHNNKCSRTYHNSSCLSLQLTWLLHINNGWLAFCTLAVNNNKGSASPPRNPTLQFWIKILRKRDKYNETTVWKVIKNAIDLYSQSITAATNLAPIDLYRIHQVSKIDCSCMQVDSHVRIQSAWGPPTAFGLNNENMIYDPFEIAFGLHFLRWWTMNGVISISSSYHTPRPEGLVGNK